MAEQTGDQPPVRLGDKAIVDEEVSVFQRLYQLPPDKRWPMTSGLAVISMNSALVGLICNSYLRRMCMLRGKGIVLSMVPIAGGTAIVTQAVWQVSVVQPLLEGRLRCPLCAELRGGLINFTFGVFYPLLMAIPLNGGLAAMYNTIDVPKLSKTSFVELTQFWISKLRYFKVRFVTLSIFQAIMGGYLAGKQFETAELVLNEERKEDITYR